MFDSKHVYVELSKDVFKASFNEIHLDKPYYTGSFISLMIYIPLLKIKKIIRGDPSMKMRLQQVSGTQLVNGV